MANVRDICLGYMLKCVVFETTKRVIYSRNFVNLLRRLMNNEINVVLV